MNDPLAAYLHDHLAGARYAIDLVEALRDHFRDEPLGHFADTLLKDITEDRDTLRNISQRIGSASNALKESAAWLGEKISRFKLNHSDSTGLGTFEALEFLQLGIHGKVVLWRALAEVAANDKRLSGIDFEALVRRAQNQEMLVEQRRLQAARESLQPPAARAEGA
jgi:hypothetical protein